MKIRSQPIDITEWWLKTMKAAAHIHIERDNPNYDESPIMRQVPFRSKFNRFPKNQPILPTAFAFIRRYTYNFQYYVYIVYVEACKIQYINVIHVHVKIVFTNKSMLSYSLHL